MIDVIAYKCNHCRKISEDKGYIKQHEKKCYYNPDTQSCATCKYLIFGNIEDPKRPGYFNKEFQSCTLGIDVKLRQLKTNCANHKVRPQYDDDIDGIDFELDFHGPYFIRAGQSFDFPE
jgi:hypothetical protein